VSEESLESAIARSLERNDVDLPLKPEIVTRVLALSRDPDACFNHLSRLIHNDPMLAAHVIRVSNSSAYMGRVRITTLRQAVTRIGMRMLSELAITVGISEVFRVPGFEHEAEHIWRHALTTASFAREVAKICGAHEEASFLCGLLHTIGRPVVLRTAVSTANEMGEDISHEEIVDLLEAWEATVGRRLGAAWDLPRPVREAILHHQDFTKAEIFRDLVAVTQLASLMATRVIDDEVLAEGLKEHPATCELEISEEAMDDLIERAEKSLLTVRAIAA